MNFSKLNVAILGAGLMGHWHAYYANKLGAKVVAVIDPQNTFAQDLARRYKKTLFFSNLQTALNHVHIDVLHICTPKSSHFELSLLALNSGVHVIVEKPLTDDVSETQILIEKAKTHNLKLLPVHQFPFQRSALKAIEALNCLDGICRIEFTICSAGGEGSTKEQLSAVIADILPHPLSLLKLFVPSISLENIEWLVNYPVAGELSVITDINGVSVSIYISQNSRPTRCGSTIYCRKGRIHLNLFHDYAVIEKGRHSRLQKLIQPLKFNLFSLISSSTNLIYRAMTGEKAYPGLRSLISQYYQTIIFDKLPPISNAEILDVAIARERIMASYMAVNIDNGKVINKST